MCSKRIIFYFLFTFLFTSNCFLISGSKEIVSPLRIAQCRSRCLQKTNHLLSRTMSRVAVNWGIPKGNTLAVSQPGLPESSFNNVTFSDGQKTKQNDCLQGADCFMCWENCELLQANFHIWGSICKADICYPGCQEACKFHRDSPQEKQVEPVIKARGEEVLKIEGDVAKWPKPTSVSSQSPLVYIVMRKNIDSSWTQIIQTADRSVPLPPDTLAANIRVLVVNPEGLVTMYSPAIPIHEKLNDSIVSRIMAGVSTRKTDRISINTPKSNTWELKEVSLIHQKVLVLAEVSWEPRLRHTVYLVTWEVDGGGLKGNLFTDSTCVTLSLWPDTVYHIQVEVVSKTDKSVPLVLDTHKATQVSFDLPQTSQSPLLFNEYKDQKQGLIPELPKISLEDTLKSKSTEMSIQISQNIDKLIHNPSVARKIFSNEKSKKDVSLEEQFDTPKSNLKSPPRISSSLSSVLVKSADSEAELIDTRQRTELAFGSAAAVILFLIICVLVVLKTKRKLADGSDGAVTINGEKLIDSGTNFQPVVVISEPIGPQPTRFPNSVTKDLSQISWKNNPFVTINEQQQQPNTKLNQSNDEVTRDSLSNFANRGASEFQV